jgi:hypothetical protein
MTKEGGSSTSASDADTDDSECSDPESNQLKQIDYENEFGDTELEELVKSKGPQEILQLIIQEQADDFMKEKITDFDDYADWIHGCLMQSKGNKSSLQLRSMKKRLYCCNSNR